jgi:hypothetical protein
LVDELIAALNAHDAAAVGELMTVDAEYICWSGDAWATTHGAEAIVRLIDGYDKELSSDFRLTTRFAVVAEDLGPEPAAPLSASPEASTCGTESALRVTRHWAISRDRSTHVTVVRVGFSDRLQEAALAARTLSDGACDPVFGDAAG